LKCLYGIPITENALSRLVPIAQSLKILLLIDSVQQVEFLEEYVTRHDEIKKWEIFIKIDVGSCRAGVAAGSLDLSRLIQRAEASPAVSIYGIYCHAGHSYSCRTQQSVESVLEAEISGVLQASQLVSLGKRSLVLSIGSTPTAHSIRSISNKLPRGIALELHAGKL
jgi:D-serine deaminase-like pyridoxal phosphate-dependent protein